MIPSEFCNGIVSRKPEWWAITWWTNFDTIRLAVLTQCRTMSDGHLATAYTALYTAIASRGKNYLTVMCVARQANFATVVRDIARQWHALSDEEWTKYSCKHNRHSAGRGKIGGQGKASKGDKKESRCKGATGVTTATEGAAVSPDKVSISAAPYVSEETAMPTSPGEDIPSTEDTANA